MASKVNQEGAEVGVNPSGVGSKRRARASVTSSAIGSSTSPTALIQPNGDDPSSSTSGPSSGRPRRASRVFSQLADGFRRSESTRSLAGAGITRRSGKDASLPVENSNSGAHDMDVQGLPRSSSYAVEKQSQMERRDKRRRIGEYAGPSRVSSSENVTTDSDTTNATYAIDTPVILASPLEASSKEVLQPTDQDAATPVEPAEASAAPLFSPPIVPLTDSDPFLNDRLRSLEAIRSVLGDDVVRRLPSVQSLRDLNQAHASAAPAAETSETEIGDRNFEAGSGRRISIPPSTLELLHDLESTTAPSTAAVDTPREEYATPTDSSQRPVYQTSASAESSIGRSPTQQAERNARRASIRNFTNRLGGWLGVGAPRNETSNETAATSTANVGAHSDMAVDPQSTPAGSTTTVPIDGVDAAQTETNASGATSTTSITGNRLAAGAVMIVQGFVQTTAPTRERRTGTSRNSVAGPSRPTTASNIHRSGAQPNPNSAGISESSSSAPVTDAIPSIARLSASEPQQAPSRSETARWGELEAEEEVRDDGAPIRLISGQNDPLVPRPSTATVSEAPLAGGEPGVGAPSGSSIPPNATGSSNTAAGQSATTAASGTQADARGEQPSFVQQARMLGGLLSVATAATATSLLNNHQSNPAAEGPAPMSDATAQRLSGPRAALEALRNRLRSTGHAQAAPDVQTTNEAGAAGNVPDRGVEDVLREYMRHAMASSRNPGEPNGEHATSTMPSLSTILPTTDPASFEAFLNDMQTALIQSLREFVEGSEDDQDREDRDSAPVGATHQHVSTETSAAESTSASPANHPSVAGSAPIPTPRQLNFFRMFQFPARSNPPAQPNDPAVDLIPAVIVGVRSMDRDINSVTAENVAAAPFPFNDTDNIQGRDQAATAAPSSESAPAQPDAEVQPSTDLPELAAPNQERTGSWSARALRSFNRLRRQRATTRNEREGEAENDTSTRNYVLWVVGGNYPVGHPILTLPHLFTGELSHDDLWVLAEALGQVKPPVASRTDIQNSGLVIVKGGQVKDEAATGSILANCVEQCLICLAEYEEDEVRIMSCKHAFHKDCIDHWLEVGRNSCPACRQAGVTTASERTASSTAASSSINTSTTPPTASSETNTPAEDVNMS
ncbi:hypothetical protein QFC21_001089 [Naganishia friedmannii]|uniref:Uncharacterized protein n=1 Tax=Naganishia friedmannii TaxID=89922 RepID=A0ACC2W8U6_9TREE|nr:hypothetical protein QFC21_001089 [Naganishia friedmannii]